MMLIILILIILALFILISYGPSGLFNTVLIYIVFTIAVLPSVLTNGAISFDFTLAFLYFSLKYVNPILGVLVFVLFTGMNPLHTHFMKHSYEIKDYQRYILFYHRIPEVILYLFIIKYSFILVFCLHVIVNLILARWYAKITKTNFISHNINIILFTVIPNLLFYFITPILGGLIL